MKSYEVYFYDTDEEMLLHQGRIAAQKSMFNNLKWKIVKSKEVNKTEKLAFEGAGMDPKKHLVVIENQ